MDKITAVIRKKGLNIVEFCTTILNTDYKAFRARIREDRLRLSEIRLILRWTNLTFEQLFQDEDIPIRHTPLTEKEKEGNDEPFEFKVID